MPQLMKAVIKEKAEPGAIYGEVPVPGISSDDILVKVLATSICGTDLHIYKWDQWSQSRVHPPTVMGHEVTGEVVEIGDNVKNIKVGDRVSLESHVVCNMCRYCRTGLGHICENTSLIGVDRDGGFAEYIAIPAQNAWVNPPDMPLEIAVLFENFGNAVHTAFSCELSAKKVLVTGCGPVGLMTIAVAKAIGARSVFATDISDYRVNFARKMGADVAINARESDAMEELMHATRGEGVDVLLEMSGSPSAIDQGFKLLKPGGEAALLGVVGKDLTVDWDHHIVFKAAQVKGVSGRRLWQTWYQARGLVYSGAVDLSPMVTHTFKLSEFDKALDTMASGESGKVMMVP